MEAVTEDAIEKNSGFVQLNDITQSSQCKLVVITGIVAGECTYNSDRPEDFDTERFPMNGRFRQVGFSERFSSQYLRA